MLKSLYNKSKIWFAVMWIVVYCVFMSVGDSLSLVFRAEKSVTLAIGLFLSAVLLLFLKKNNLFASYGLCSAKTPAKEMLYYVPVFLMLTTNLWYGLTLNYGILEMVFYIMTMFCVGFLEEVIFRGLLFEAMRKDGVKSAIIVSSITFGIGHIINLVNGSGAELVSNLLQVVYATAAGFMFVMIYYKTRCLLVCIAAHGAFNALSVFANEGNATREMQMLTAVFLTVITGGYAVYIALSMKNRALKEDAH